MRNLKGYIRNIKIGENTCEINAPNLFCNRSGFIKEITIELNDLCQELVDYLDCNCRPLEKTDNSGYEPDSIISILEISNRFESELHKDDSQELTVFRQQLCTLSVMCDAIAMLGGLNNFSSYLEFKIT